MTAKREKTINEWLGKHCRNCANNDDRGTPYVNCQAECEVQKDIGIACIHYEEADAEDIKDKVRDLRLKAKSINENLGEWLSDGIWNRFGSLCDEVIKTAEEIADTLRVLKDNAREFVDGDD